MAPWWRGSRCLAHQVCVYVSLGRCSGYSSPPQATGSSADNDNDWDVTPMDKWTHGMCVQWMRDEARWSEDDLSRAAQWLRKYSYPGKHITAMEMKDNIPGVTVDTIDEFKFALDRINSPGTISSYLLSCPYRTLC